MPTFRLIVDREQADAFAHLGPPVEIEASGLTRFVWEDERVSESVRARILLMNRAGYTCLFLPKREWKAAFFDMDSTVIRQESIVELARAAGKEAEVAEITEQAMAGLLDFTSALKQRVRMLQDLPISVLSSVASTLTINPGMHQLSTKAKERGIKLYLVSGGFNALASIIAKELRFDGFIANELDTEGDRLTGELRGTLVNAETKAQFLADTCTSLGIHPNDTFVVGDGANDLLMMQSAGAAIGYFPKSVLLPHLSGATFRDHRAILHAL